MMPSRTRTAGCCYRRPRCRSLEPGYGGEAFAQRARANTRSRIRLSTASPSVSRPGAKREPVLVAWGFTIEGRRMPLHMMAGSKEDAETVTAFFEDMKRRGLNDPLLVTSDGAPGIVKAIEICFPRAACRTHKVIKSCATNLAFLARTELALAERSERTRSTAKWILSLLWLPRPWRLSSRRLPGPFPWPGLRRPSALSDRPRRLEASSPVRSFPSPHFAALLRGRGSPAVFRAMVKLVYGASQKRTYPSQGR